MRKDLHDAFRSLARAPGFSAIAIATLAFGFAASTTVFSIADAVLLRPLPYSDDDQLVMLWHRGPAGRFPQSNGTFAWYRERNTTFTDIGISSEPFDINIMARGEPLRVPMALVSASLFPVLGVAPRQGRGFLPSDERPGGRAVILGHQLWTSRFGADPGVIGQAIDVSGSPMPVVGVMPPGFLFPEGRTQLWLSNVVDPATLGRTTYMFEAVGRLRPGVTREQAERDIERLTPQLPQVYPEMTTAMVAGGRMSPFVTALKQEIVGEVARPLGVLVGGVLLVLLIACANVVNLVLVRAEERMRSVAVRSVLGASPARLVRGFLAEGLVLAAAGAAAGLAVGAAAIRLLARAGPVSLPRLDEATITSTVVTSVMAVTLLVGLAAGILPALRVARADLAGCLAAGGRAGGGGRRRWVTSRVLTAAQIGLAMPLLVAGGLLVRSFVEIGRVHPGFQSSGVLTLGLSLNRGDYPGAADVARFYQRLLNELHTLAGVVSAGGTTRFPLKGSASSIVFLMEDHPLPPDERPPSVRYSIATPGYFETMGIPLLRGRTFEPRDAEENTGAVVLSASLARRYWPNTSPIGRRVSPTATVEDGRWYTVVGVVGDVRDDSLEGVPVEMAYFAMVNPSQNTGVPVNLTVAIRSGIPAAALAEQVRLAVASLDPRLPVFDVRTLDGIVAASLARRRFTMLLLAVGAAAALVLGTVGLYALVAHAAGQRRREFAVRIAIGAEPRQVGRLVFRQGLAVALAGATAGL
ncbi:MAG TPA: ADOP family duplicated permease, partial [Vicinamibacterales bacterium]|nr:ADOP family duplicated permease [Vicinamibacterales bacterium]